MSLHVHNVNPCSYDPDVLSSTVQGVLQRCPEVGDVRDQAVDFLLHGSLDSRGPVATTGLKTIFLQLSSNFKTAAS